MVCKNCGRTIVNENANFCEYCGDNLRETGYTADVRSAVNENANVSEIQQSIDTAGVNDKEYISTAKWLGFMLLQFIPVLGGIIYFVMLIIWSFDETKPWYKKNWARASLLFMIISFVVTFVLFIEMYKFVM